MINNIRSRTVFISITMIVVDINIKMTTTVTKILAMPIDLGL